MNKLIKLSAVSMLAIVAATGANAAGYTCEELIQYTSCNPGYYLNNGDCIGLVTSCDAGYYLTGAQYDCPDGYVSYQGGCGEFGTTFDITDVVSGTTNTCPSGYTYSSSICLQYGEYTTNLSESECSDDWIGSGCYKRVIDYDYLIGDTDGVLVGGTSCVAAPAGSYSPGGLVVSATKCAAGTYQPQSAQSSCITTPKGNYSIAGATAYTACPATGLTDKDGNTVVATTATEGATTLAACIVDENVYFADTKGTYHYKSNCAIDMFAAESYSVTNEAECEAVDGYWYEPAEECVVDGSSLLPKTEAECNKLASKVGKEGDAELTWSNGVCTCDATGDGYQMVWSGTSLYCTHY